MRFVGSFFLSIEAMNPGIGLCFWAGVLCIGMIWISGCSSLATARSSTLSAISNPASPHNPDYLEYRQGCLTEAPMTIRDLRGRQGALASGLEKPFCRT